MSVVDAYSPEEAKLLAAKIFKRECSGWGDEERALTKVARQCGMTATSFKRLMKGHRKIIDLSLCKRIRGVYVDVCHSLITQLQNDIKAIEEVHGHDAVADFMDEFEGLDAKVRAAKAATSTARAAANPRQGR